MPELAAMYSVGALISMIVATLFALRQRAKYFDPRMVRLQKNLNLIGYRWNDLNLSVDPLGTDPAQAELAEYKKARATTIIFAVMSVIFSWGGLFFILLMWMSLNLLNKSKAKKILLESPLSESEELTAQQASHIFERLPRNQ